MQQAIDWPSHRKVVVLTGAGISVASGLRPYRGPGGLWEELNVDQVADHAAVESDPNRVWSFFQSARAEIARARPNPAHLALAQLQEQIEAPVTILTQNIDGLHQRAGSRNVVELHGCLGRSRCSRCSSKRDEDQEASSTVAPPCPECGAPLRPDVVLFGEPLPVQVEWAAKKALRGCDLFIAVGTSGTVAPASNYVRSADYEGARTILVNLEPMDPPNPYFREERLGRAEEILPALLGVQGDGLKR